MSGTLKIFIEIPEIDRVRWQQVEAAFDRMLLDFMQRADTILGDTRVSYDLNIRRPAEAKEPVIVLGWIRRMHEAKG